jgi:hypothetical protein
MVNGWNPQLAAIGQVNGERHKWHRMDQLSDVSCHAMTGTLIPGIRKARAGETRHAKPDPSVPWSVRLPPDWTSMRAQTVS